MSRPQRRSEIRQSLLNITDTEAVTSSSVTPITNRDNPIRQQLVSNASTSSSIQTPRANNSSNGTSLSNAGNSTSNTRSQSESTGSVPNLPPIPSANPSGTPSPRGNVAVPLIDSSPTPRGNMAVPTSASPPPSSLSQSTGVAAGSRAYRRVLQTLNDNNNSPSVPNRNTNGGSGSPSTRGLMSQQSSRTIVINADETPRDNNANDNETVANSESVRSTQPPANNQGQSGNQATGPTANQGATSTRPTNASTQGNSNQGVPNSIARQNSILQSNADIIARQNDILQRNESSLGVVDANRVSYAPQRRFRREGVNAQSNNVANSDDVMDSSGQNGGQNTNDTDRAPESNVIIQQFPNLTRPVPSEEIRNSSRSQQGSRTGGAANNRPLLSRRSSRPNLLQRSVSSDSSTPSNTVRHLPDRNRTLSNSRAPVSRRNSNTSTVGSVPSGAQASNPAARARRRSEIMQDSKTKRQTNGR